MSQTRTFRQMNLETLRKTRNNVGDDVGREMSKLTISGVTDRSNHNYVKRNLRTFTIADNSANTGDKIREYIDSRNSQFRLLKPRTIDMSKMPIISKIH